jgi:hypothetical protein
MDVHLGIPQDVVISGKLAYVVDGYGLRIFDISSPLNPRVLGSVVTISIGGGWAADVVVSGAYAYVAAFDDGLYVVDVSDPTAPNIVSYLPLRIQTADLAVAGHYLYLDNYWGIFNTYDVSDPTAPVQVNIVPEPGNAGPAYGIAVSSNYVYVGNYFDGLRVYDVSTITNPVNIAHVGGINVWPVVVSGSYAFAGVSGRGVLIFDVSDPTNPVELGQAFNTNGITNVKITGLAVSGHYLYVAGDAGSANLENTLDGLQIFDLSDPANPVFVGHNVDCPYGSNVAVSGDYAFLAPGGSYGGGFPLLVYSLVPELQITRTSTGTMLISWVPLSSSTFDLQQAENASASSWIEVTNSVSVVNGVRRVEVPISQGSRYFRLAKVN